MPEKKLVLIIDKTTSTGPLTIEYTIDTKSPEKLILTGKKKFDDGLVTDLFKTFFKGTAITEAYNTSFDLLKNNDYTKQRTTTPTWASVQSLLTNIQYETRKTYNEEVLKKIISSYKPSTKERGQKAINMLRVVGTKSDIGSTKVEVAKMGIFQTDALNDIFAAGNPPTMTWEDITNRFFDFYNKKTYGNDNAEINTLEKYIQATKLAKWAPDLTNWVSDSTKGKPLRAVPATTSISLFRGGAAQRTRKFKNYKYDDETDGETDGEPDE